jgi:hypothetical protein
MFSGFSVLLRSHLYITIPLLLLIWVTAILIFAAIYVHIDTSNLDVDCGLGDPGFPITFATGFAFSLETCTTVGCKFVVVTHPNLHWL